MRGIHGGVGDVEESCRLVAHFRDLWLVMARLSSPFATEATEATEGNLELC